MSDDPRLDGEAFRFVMDRIGVPMSADHAWHLTPVERGRILRQHRRRLLVSTPAGRRRLRRWLDQQRGQPIDTPADRRRRVAGALFFLGDIGVLNVVATTLASLPAPVLDAALNEAVFVASGRSSSGWISGSFPAGRRVIALAGHRSDAEVAATIRHEVGHLWSLDQTDASSEQHAARAVAEMVDRLAALADRPTADRFVRGQWLVTERHANALRTAWEAPP